MATHDRSHTPALAPNPTGDTEEVQQPSLEGENRRDPVGQDAGGGDGDGAGAPGAAEPPPSGDHLAGALQALLSHPGDGDDDAMYTAAARSTIECWPSLPERAALQRDTAFWGQPFWRAAGRDPSRWIDRVDPLHDALLALGETSGSPPGAGSRAWPATSTPR